MAELTCPECGKPMRLKFSRKFNRDFYGCTGYPNCKCTHGAHPDGKPKGKPGDGPTRSARIECHSLLDIVWQENHMSRRNAYRLLAKLMDLRTEEAHIGAFGLADCEKFKQRWVEWQSGDNPAMQFHHLFTTDLRRILEKAKATGKSPWPVEIIEEEITRRDAHRKELTETPYKTRYPKHKKRRR